MRKNERGNGMEYQLRRPHLVHGAPSCTKLKLDEVMDYLKLPRLQWSGTAELEYYLKYNILLVNECQVVWDSSGAELKYNAMRGGRGEEPGGGEPGHSFGSPRTNKVFIARTEYSDTGSQIAPSNYEKVQERCGFFFCAGCYLYPLCIPYGHFLRIYPDIPCTTRGSTVGHEGERAIREENDIYHTLVLVQHLIVLGQRAKEQQRREIHITMDECLPLWTLATDVEASKSRIPQWWEEAMREKKQGNDQREKKKETKETSPPTHG
ncbi:hypothetical protein C8J57DRAFT_1483558 [Mycena rebaudengoi]|nr:hypothetical protein C8J57DRAFT_1483558 [Mycena rebaudengoi]